MLVTIFNDQGLLDPSEGNNADDKDYDGKINDRLLAVVQN